MLRFEFNLVLLCSSLIYVSVRASYTQIIELVSYARYPSVKRCFTHCLRVRPNFNVKSFCFHQEKDGVSSDQDPTAES